jgi:hypothetical protein
LEAKITWCGVQFAANCNKFYRLQTGTFVVDERFGLNLLLMWHRAPLLFMLGWWMACTTTPPPIEEPLPVIEPKPAATPVIPRKTLPRGWSLQRELLARWGTSLPTVTSVIPDTLPEVEFWDAPVSVGETGKLPIKRATVRYQYTTRITVEQVELHFVNVDYVYSVLNHEPSHYILERVVRTVELKDTGFPQLTADDVIKHKVLMVYGTPQNYDGVWHQYRDSQTEMKVREVDERHLVIDLRSLAIERRLQQALQEVYSEEGIEQKKREIMEGLDL